MAKVIFLMADYGHDPTETAVPFTAFREAGYNITFATEQGNIPKCDARMLEGVTQLILGAKRPVVDQYHAMAESSEWKSPVSWSAPDFTLDGYHLVFLPGGHEKGVRQVIDSSAVHRLLVDYFPQTRKPSSKVVGAVCHGVMVLAESRTAEGGGSGGSSGGSSGGGKSVLHGACTTALPTRFEQLAFWGTRLFLGDYYKTYGAGSDNVQEAVTKVLAKPEHFKNSLAPAPFVVEDETFNYISARFPGDAHLLADKLVTLVNSCCKA